MDEEISKRLGETPTGEHLQLPLNIDKVQEIWQTDKSFSKREMNSLVAEISQKSLLQWVGHLGQLGKCTWVSRSSLLSVSSYIKLAVASTNKHCFLHSMIFASFFFFLKNQSHSQSQGLSEIQEHSIRTTVGREMVERDACPSPWKIKNADSQVPLATYESEPLGVQLKHLLFKSQPANPDSTLTFKPTVKYAVHKH